MSRDIKSGRKRFVLVLSVIVLYTGEVAVIAGRKLFVYLDAATFESRFGM